MCLLGKNAGITGKSRIKYLFPPHFQAGEHVYNLVNFDPTIKYALLTEGGFDVYGWARFGVKNVGGSFGKKLSGKQVDLLLMMGIEDILLGWDSDAHWERDVLCESWGHLFNIKILDLGGKDSDECSRQEAANALALARAYNWSEKILACL